MIGRARLHQRARHPEEDHHGEARQPDEHHRADHGVLLGKQREQEAVPQRAADEHGAAPLPTAEGRGHKRATQSTQPGGGQQP